jgi:hypothetical protein
VKPGATVNSAVDVTIGTVKGAGNLNSTSGILTVGDELSGLLSVGGTTNTVFASGATLNLSENASPFPKTGPMAETIILGTVAVRCPDETLSWNADALAFDGNPAATALLRRTYRTGW